MIDIQSLIFGIVLTLVVGGSAWFLLFKKGGIDITDAYSEDAEARLQTLVDHAHDVTNRRAS